MFLVGIKDTRRIQLEHVCGELTQVLQKLEKVEGTTEVSWKSLKQKRGGKKKKKIGPLDEKTS